MSGLPAFEHEEATIAGLQAALSSGTLTSRSLTEAYLERIDSVDPLLGSVLETNPDALEIADALDAERVSSGPRGPMHGIPVLVKDNIDTADRMRTTAGSFALDLFANVTIVVDVHEQVLAPLGTRLCVMAKYDALELHWRFRADFAHDSLGHLGVAARADPEHCS